MKARIIYGLLLILFFIPVHAEPLEDEEPLMASEAFVPAIKKIDDKTVEVTWDIVDGYYMYRKEFQFKSETPAVTLGTPVFPKGKVKKDETYATVETYVHQVKVQIPIQVEGGVSQLDLWTRSQGCSEKFGVCYQPEKKTLKVSLAHGGGAAAAKPLIKLGQFGKELGLSEDPQFLTPEKAFIFTSQVVDASTILARFDIAEGYYLYRSRFEFKLQPSSARLSHINMPPGEMKTDKAFGRQEVYHNRVDIMLTLERPMAKQVVLQAKFQGCAEAGFCYAPIKASHTLAMNSPGSAGGTGGTAGAGGGGSIFTAISNWVSNTYYFMTDTEELKAFISSKNYWVVLPFMFAIGLALAFTPCVFPMVPILSSIIAGQGDNTSSKKAFAMSLVYVLAMAFTYTSVGVVVGMLSQGFDAMFQNPYVLSTFALVFVALSLAMFGYYDLQLPSSWQSKLSEISNRQKGGTMTGVAIMGVLSALIVGPCVAAPLAAIVLMISEAQDPVWGGMVLMATTLGMGTPLLMVGTAAGRYLPRAGGWMEIVKGIFGLLLLGMAVYFLGRFIQPPLINYMYLAWIVGSIIYLTEKIKLGDSPGIRPQLKKYGWTTAFALAAYWFAIAPTSNTVPGASQQASVVETQNTSGEQGDEYRTTETVAGLRFHKVKGLRLVNEIIAEAKTQGKGVFIDVFADWCTYCKQMDRTTFADPIIQAKLGNMVLVKVDITKDDDINRELRKKYRLITPPPVYIFLDTQGNEIKGTRMYGYKNTGQFLRKLEKASS